MKKSLVLALIVVVAICVVTGCIARVKTYTDSGQIISIGANQEFIIALGSNPTTGYVWQESYDESTLELVEKTYEPTEADEQDTAGAGGTDYFRFKALKTGKTEITLVYKRSWEESTPQDITKRFSVEIK